jgi:hypothetical protein
MFKLYLDPGHGTKTIESQDPGATANGLRECDVALEVAQRIMAMLPSWVEAMMCRADSESPKGVDARAAEANEWGADFVLSLHCNSFDDPTANGVETLITGTGGKAELCAGELLAYYVSALGLYNRGIKVRPDLAILRKTYAPAVVLELGFLTNLSDAALLRNGQAVIAGAIVEGVMACARVLGKAGADTGTTSEYAALPDMHAVTILPERFKVIEWKKGKQTTDIQNYACFIFQASGTVPVGNIIAAGKRLSNFGGFSTLWVNEDGSVGFGKTPHSTAKQAASGFPLIADGKEYTLDEVLSEGWDTTPLYPTTHAIFGYSGDGMLHYYVFSTTKAGAEASFAEIQGIARQLGLKYALLGDGGGSTILDIGGTKKVISEGNRQLATLIRF